ncbi:hypothetical protein F4777DRAFT_572169 [Nemania sp. FL0916]|nr:hypothetical protein F4777DRAFT_572169 [Nemania sp. FL0916]
MAISWREVIAQQQQASQPRESRRDYVIIVISVFLFLSIVASALRFYTRLKVQHLRPGLDDWAILGSWIASTAFYIDLIIETTKYDLGQHLQDLPPDTDYITWGVLLFARQHLYTVCVTLTKISIIIFYFQLFPQKSYRRFLWFMAVVIACTALASSLADIFQCTPVARAWDPSIKGTCYNRVALFYANGALNVAEDLVLYLLPVRILWAINLPHKQRLGLIAVFMVGGVTVIAGIIRIPMLKDTVESADRTWKQLPPPIWTFIECSLGIVCACLVHFKPLLAKMVPSLQNLYRPYKRATTQKLSDGQSDQQSNLQTFGQRQRHKPVGILTEIAREESASRSQTALVPATYGGVVTATAARGEDSLPHLVASMPNVIYTVRDYTVSYR